ncbi:MAG TPA: hypothetical protein VLM79_38435 [Kofleriaceae bacterium]|nr:hypothetical protein [Kofleriaceae bacterium]
MIARGALCMAVCTTACATACAAACATSNDDAPAAWSTVFSELDRVALSVWSGHPDDVYIVGGGLGASGASALALHWDGSRWRDLAPGREQTLWWVTGVPEHPNDVWMVGEAGTVLRWDGTSFVSIASPTQATLFGAWAAAPDDVWIVGGIPGAGKAVDNDVVLHWDGQHLVRDDTLPRRGTALLKVWGSDPGELWVVGEHGALWHRTQGRWDDHSMTSSTLFSVHGCGRDDVYAVGGSQLLHFDGSAWSQVGPSIYGSAIGVVCGRSGALITGAGGLKLRWDRLSGAWHDDQLVAPWDTDFHAAWIDAEGGNWVAGGNFNQASQDVPRVGIVAYYGARPPPADGSIR